ncbi:hypothetical protein DEO72_LG5g2194 [Vigna unguiculata]|uniref:Uncharacterized protein n=1 Tax=Vigna unguiculata TaxID=3917 RepID=A0A4D6LZB5_VIGUN|nr:hypothetical protein DEO72_LG5g2194 [Vigna unguiculata]
MRVHLVGLPQTLCVSEFRVRTRVFRCITIDYTEGINVRRLFQRFTVDWSRIPPINDVDGLIKWYSESLVLGPC